MQTNNIWYFIEKWKEAYKEEEEETEDVTVYSFNQVAI